MEQKTIENNKFETRTKETKGAKIVDAKQNAPKTNRLHLKHDKSFKLLLSMKEKFIRNNALNKQEINRKIVGVDGWREILDF